MNFEDILQQSGIEIRHHGEHHHTSEGWIQFDCPYCSPGSGNFRCGYNILTRAVNCWSCGALRLIKVIQDMMDIPFHMAVKVIHDLPQREIVRSEETGEYAVPFPIHRFGREHKTYLKNRGFEGLLLVLEELWTVRCTSQFAGQYRWSLFIPVIFRGETVTWITRSINPNAERRYQNAPLRQSSVSIRDVLYGSDLIKDTVIIVEGPLDVWKIGPGAVALCGKGMSHARLEFLSKVPNRYVCLDSDPESQNTARKICDDLSVFYGTTTNIVLKAKDPGEADHEELQQLKELLV